jgi:hypothetical protein
MVSQHLETCLHLPPNSFFKTFIGQIVSDQGYSPT